MNVASEYGTQQVWGKGKSGYDALGRPDAGRLGALAGNLAIAANKDHTAAELKAARAAEIAQADKLAREGQKQKAVEILMAGGYFKDRRDAEAYVQKVKAQADGLPEGDLVRDSKGNLFVRDKDGMLHPLPKGDQSRAGVELAMPGFMADTTEYLRAWAKTLDRAGRDLWEIPEESSGRKPSWEESANGEDRTQVEKAGGSEWNAFGNDDISYDAIEILDRYKTTQRIFMHNPGFMSAKTQREILDDAMGGAQNTERFLEQMFRHQRNNFGPGVKNSWRDWVTSAIDMITALPIDAPMGEPIPAETLFAKQRKEEYQNWVKQLRELKGDPLAQAAFMIGSEKGEELGQVAGAVSQLLAEAAVGSGLARVAKWARGPMALKGGPSSRGFAFEIEARMRVELELGERTLDAQHSGRAGIDFLSIRGDGLNAELIINEVKHTDVKKYVPAGKFTAINQNLDTNLAFARQSIEQAQNEGKISFQTAQTLISQIDTKTAKIRLIGREGHTMFSARTVQKLQRITGMPIDHIFHIPGIKP